MEGVYKVEKVFLEWLFHIPDYQRGYAWEAQQYQDFIEDLELLQDGKEHFMGTLILQAHPDSAAKVIDTGGRSYARHDVVDGQQRLTTVVLFLDAICRELEAAEGHDELVAGLRRNYIASLDLNKQPLAKLTLNQDTRAYFRKAILGSDESILPAKIRLQERLLEAKKYFAQYFERKRGELSDDYSGWLMKLYFQVIHQLTFMVYRVRGETDAGIVFETMNNRGKPLTELEKVKNYLLYLAGRLDLPVEHDLAAQINRTWKHIYESLMASHLSGRGHEDQLLRAHWLMAYDPQRSNWDRSRSIKNQFDLPDYALNPEDLLEEVRRYLHSLTNATTAYCDILKPDRPGAFEAYQSDSALRRKIVIASGRLARVGSMASFLPLLISARIRQDGQTYLETVNLCEKFSFRVYRWTRHKSNTGQSRLFRLGNHLYHGQQVEFVLTDLQRTTWKYCTNARFQERFQSKDEDWYHWAGIKYFLYEYEQHLADQEGIPIKMPWAEVSRKQDTIEHVLPQTPDKDGYWQSSFPGELYNRYKNDIGNLALTYDNAKLSNKPFLGDKQRPGKKDIYTGPVAFLMEREIGTVDDWDPDKIEARRQKIEVWAIKRWHVEKPLEATPGDVEASSRKYTRAKIQALADRNGVGDVYRTIVDKAAQYGIPSRPWAHCVTLSPPSNRRYALGGIWPKPGRVSVGIWFSAFPEFFDISEEEVKAILGSSTWRSVDENNLAEFETQLERLFVELGLTSS
jgi:hypothetical protein